MSIQQSQHEMVRMADDFAGALWFEDVVSFRTQRLFLTIGFFTLLLLIVGWWIEFQIGILPTEGVLQSTTVLPVLFAFGGIILIGLLTLTALHGFYLYFRLAEPVESEGAGGEGVEQLTFPAAEILLRANRADSLAYGFLFSRFGQHIFLRSGIDVEVFLDRLRNEQVVSLGAVMADANFADTIDIADLAELLYENDSVVQELLFSEGVSKEQFTAAARWIQNRDRRFRKHTRIWAKERLDNVTPLGEDFSYGKAFTLDKFSKSSTQTSVFGGASSSEAAFSNDVDQVLNLLSRAKDANALIVGSVAGGVSDIISQIRSRVQTGNVPDAVAGHHVKILDTQAIITATENKTELDRLLDKMLTEATNAGNVLLVIENLTQFRAQAESIGVDAYGILQKFLQHPALPIIATATESDYHRELEGSGMMQHFGAVQAHEVEGGTLERLLQQVAESNEGQAVCTVSGLNAIARSGRELITDDEMPNAAVNLLLEVLGTVSSGFVDRDYVDSFVSDKTGVPTGAIDDEERTALSGLDQAMQERVVGQKGAIDAVTKALKRNRSGVEAQDKPIGTFLFLGPTGVGKTETAKTLAREYFSGENAMQRLDMSEYSQPQSADNLRGRSGESGRFANMMRENPYGVLLLDEFEKAHRRVHDLFLQILDEGYFTDGRGRRVSLINNIIIATSNAGSDKIFQMVQNGENPETKQDELVRHLVDSGMFRPELLNRFDATVVYHPLTKDELIEITGILIRELEGRIHDRGFRLDVEDAVISYIVEHGYDPQFGARAIQRVIQDTAENVIAEKIINKGLQAGDTITLRAADLRDENGQ